MTREKTWEEICAEAPHRTPPGFTEAEKAAARDWSSCACRDVPADARYDETYDYGPIDILLNDWGFWFAAVVADDDFDLAADLDRKIRERIAELYGARKEKR